jgi:DNA-binding LacI/PurR family transcriptional regulator
MQRRFVVRPTLQTVADAVGVSRSTVSNAYGRPDQLSPDLRERILEKARQLGYSGPDPNARSLRRGRVGAIGVLFTASLSYAFTDPYAVQFLRGLAESAQEQEAGLLLVPQSLEDQDAAVGAVKNAVVDGFCVYCMPDWHPSLDAIQARGLPIVSGQLRRNDGPDTLYVGVDEAGSTRLAGEHITRLGHRRVAVVADYLSLEPFTGPVELSTPDDVPYFLSRERLRGYHDALRAAGIDWATVATVGAAANSREAGAAAAAHVLDRAPRPTAVVAITDLLALGVLDALAARGLRPGHDVSVVGFDDIPQAAAAHLTTVRQPAVERGRVTGRLLFNPPTEPADRHVVLPTELIVRASTGPAPTGSD